MIDVPRWRDEFPILNTCIYLVSHSLGAMPRRTATYLQEYADTWSRRGVRAWHAESRLWWPVARRVLSLSQTAKENRMLWTLAVILIVLWHLR